MEGTYKILAEVAMNVQLAIVQRLKNLVYNSALSQDNFALYQVSSCWRVYFLTLC